MTHRKNILEIRKEYQEQLSKLKILCKDLKQSPHNLKFFRQHKLRNSRWFVSHCENKMVSDYSSFMEYEVGIKPSYLVSKQFIVERILKSQKELNREILRKDIQNGLIYGVTITDIQRIFGGVIKMKQELGMSVKSIGNINRTKSIEYIIEKINLFFTYLKNNKTKIFTIADMDEFLLENNFELTYNTIQSKLKKVLNKSMNIIAIENNLELAKEGRGLIHIFEDGEKTLSRHEKIFSMILRNSGFVYNKTYFRDVKYSDIFDEVESCRNPMTIDYVLVYKNKRIYIELAGVLRDYEKTFKENKIINSESKEKYRQQLMKKEQILKRNNVEYYIIIPQSYQTLEKIISKRNFNFIKENN